MSTNGQSTIFPAPNKTIFVFLNKLKKKQKNTKKWKTNWCNFFSDWSRGVVHKCITAYGDGVKDFVTIVKILITKTYDDGGGEGVSKTYLNCVTSFMDDILEQKTTKKYEKQKCQLI